MRIRNACISDAEELLDIYAPYVTDTAVTFEYTVPDLPEFEGRMASVMKKYPYLVLEHDGKIQGYAYAGVFKGRAAYDWSAETTIYLRMDARQKGFGRKLYEALEQELIKRHFLNAYACITFAVQEDEYLSLASPRFHERMGYHLCGTFRKCGYKFGRWYDMIWMEKWLGDHPSAPLPPG